MVKFNDLIFKELLRRGYSLEGKTKIWNIADSKLWYLTPEQAQAYLDFISYPGSMSASAPIEMTLISTHMDELLKQIGEKPLNIIDLGCGDGRKAVLFIDRLKGKVKLRYCPIDISGYMTAKAIENVQKLVAAEVIKVQWNISDFENLENIAPLLRSGEFKQNLFLLLGNTLGNFEIHELLYEVRSGMKEGDFILIGNGLNNHKLDDSIIKSLKGSKEMDKFLGYITAQLGLDGSEVEYDARFKNSRIEFYYTLKKDKNIAFQGKNISFTKGDQIIVAVSYHYEFEDFMGYLNMYFDNVNVYLSEDKSYILALCRK